MPRSGAGDRGHRSPDASIAELIVALASWQGSQERALAQRSWLVAAPAAAGAGGGQRDTKALREQMATLRAVRDLQVE